MCEHGNTGLVLVEPADCRHCGDPQIKNVDSIKARKLQSMTNHLNTVSRLDLKPIFFLESVFYELN